MDLRKAKRYRPKEDVLVALYLSLDGHKSDDCTTFVGYLTDLSQSGLAFNYLAFNRPPAQGSCRVILTNDHNLTDPITCRVVHETAFPAETGLPDRRRCGLEFLSPLDSQVVPMLIDG